MNAVRTIVVWFPDWPVTAAGRDAGQPPDAPLAVLDKGQIFACSHAARAHGVRRGLRVREAQARCPDLVTLAYDPAVDAREFEPVVAAIEALAPGVEVIRPGRCALAAKGPSRYYGDTFGQILRTHLEEAGHSCVIGIADGPFAAEQAARLAERSGERELAFPPGESARCLASLPVDTLDRPELVDLLRRLGIRTLGAFAALPARQVLARFGNDGVAAHRLAAGRDDRPLATRRPPPELATDAAFEPPVERVDQVAFAIRGTAERLVAGLAERDLVCTCLRVEIDTERDEPRSRQWRHPRWFSAADVVDRVRWQLQGTSTRASDTSAATSVGGTSVGGGSTGATGSDGSDGSSGSGGGSGDGRPTEELTSGVVRVRLIPDDVAPTGAYQDGLWGDQAPDERIHRAFTRVQSQLGHEAVVTVVLSGGRAPAERMTLVPWGDDIAPARPTGQPWPGHLPPPAPTTVLATPEPVRVLGATGHLVEISERGALSEDCRLLERDSSDNSVITGWAGPWPVDERWWDPVAASRCARFQVACADGRAFVLRYEAGTRSTADPLANSISSVSGFNGHSPDGTTSSGNNASSIPDADARSSTGKPSAGTSARGTTASHVQDAETGRWWIEACYD
ncbi:DNA polymerase Y family protein [Actinopolymorpha sp. B9G3]|uniref:DNA polymerase Y family protein n=1 Tax=Actinopolymorpha sp. B9G3 TaxID=3158970 RepID=UPI0032D8C3AF